VLAYGSERVMEYWKNKNPTPIFCNFKYRLSRFSDAKSSRSIDHHSSTPILHRPLKLILAEPSFLSLATAGLLHGKNQP
jgi:hypothetical protein